MSEENKENTPMVVENPQNLQIVDVDSAVEYWNHYQELTEKLLSPTDYHIQGKTRFKKKSAWRKYATAFNISTKIIEEEITRDPDGRIVTAKYLVRATAPNGRSEEGVGICSIWDKAHEEDKYDYDGRLRCKGPCNGRKHYDKPEHDVPSTAHTRAKNRAISDLIGAGEVSAEEIDFSQNSNYKRKGTPIGTKKKKMVKKVVKTSDEDVIDAEYTKKEEIVDISPISEDKLKEAAKKHPVLNKVVTRLEKEKVKVNMLSLRTALEKSEEIPSDVVESILKIVG